MEDVKAADVACILSAAHPSMLSFAAMSADSRCGVRAPYELLFDRTPNPAWVIDLESLAFLSVNDAAVARYGYSRDEFLARTVRDIVVAEELERVEAWLSSSPTPSGWRHVAKDGTLLSIEAHVARFVEGGRSFALVNCIDHTERHRAEAAARENERRLQAVIDKSSDGVALNAADGTIRYLSPAVTRMLGYEPEELLSKHGATTIHPEDLERERDNFARVMRTPGGSCTSLMRNRHKDGSWRWIETATTNLLSDPGVGAIVANFRDVTDRVRAELAQKEVEAALRRSEASFRELIEHLPSGVLVHRRGRIVYVNRALATLLGREDPAELRDLSPFDLAADEDHARVRRRIATIESGQSYNAPDEGVMVRRDGTKVPVELEALRVEFAGEPAVLVIARDLSERRAMLERMATADRMRSVGMLAAGVAHEINNPLAYVITNLSMVAEELPPLLAKDPSARMGGGEIEQLLRDAREGAARVHAVVRDLLMISREGGQDLGPVDLHEAIDSCVKMASNEIRYRARVVRRFAAVPPVRANSSRLAQVFLNLIVNAAQSIAPGQADENQIEIHVRPEGAEHVVAEIRDTGSGIAPEHLGRIFDPFFTTKPMGVGTGLGLAICHGIVNSIGGEISAASTPGRGSTFRVKLPACREARTAAQDTERDRPARRGRFLVVDDEPAMGTSLRLLLAPDHDVVPLTRARDALARVMSGERFDGIVCDLMMPEMTGMDLYSAIEREAPELARRIVFLTGGAFTAESRAFLSRVPNAQLQKPLDARALRAELRRLVE